MATSILRIRFEAWANRLFLNGAAASIAGEKLGAGLLVFMAYRKLLKRALGVDYLQALPEMSSEEFSLILLNFKGVYVQMRQAESHMRKLHGDEFYDRVFSEFEPDPLAYRIAASLAVQLISAHAVPSSRLAAIRCIHGIVKKGMPYLSEAHAAAVKGRAYHEELGAILQISADEILEAVYQITAQEMTMPLAPAPAWMISTLRSLP